MTLAGWSVGFHRTEPFQKEKQQQVEGQGEHAKSCICALFIFAVRDQRASFAAPFPARRVRGWGCCCSLVPSCGAVQGDLLHLAQLCQQPFHAVFELGQTGQGFGRLQLPGVVQPALQH